MSSRPRFTLLRLGIAIGLAGALLFTARPADAQVPPGTRPPTMRPPHGHDRSNIPPRPRPRPPHGHDRSNIPPRANPNPPGQGDPHGPSDPKGPGGVTDPDSRGNGNGNAGGNGKGNGEENGNGNGNANGHDRGGPARSLAAGTLTDLGGRALPAAAQQAVLGLVEGSTPGASRSVTAALSPEANRGGQRAAARLAGDLEGLLERPEELRGAVRSYNALVDASSEAFLRAPTPEFLTVQAVLAMMVEEAAAVAVVP